MNVTSTASGLAKVVFTPADLEALLLTAAATELGLESPTGLTAHLPPPTALPAVAAYVIATNDALVVDDAVAAPADEKVVREPDRGMFLDPLLTPRGANKIAG